MKSFMELTHDPIWQDPRPWLVAGTGPTLDAWRPDYREAYRVMAIHKAALVTDPDIAVFVDWEPLKAVFARMIPRRAIVDNRIHRGFYPRLNLADAVNHHLRELYATNLYAFRTHNQTDNETELGPGVSINHASGEAAIGILANLGERTIYTIGVNAGDGHAKCMKEPYSRPGAYAAQAPHLQALADKYSLEIIPIGLSPSEEVSELVCESH